MNIKNFDALFEKVMTELDSMSPEELKQRVDSHGLGPLGGALGVPKDNTKAEFGPWARLREISAGIGGNKK